MSRAGIAFHARIATTGSARAICRNLHCVLLAPERAFPLTLRVQERGVRSAHFQRCTDQIFKARTGSRSSLAARGGTAAALVATRRNSRLLTQGILNGITGKKTKEQTKIIGARLLGIELPADSGRVADRASCKLVGGVAGQHLEKGALAAAVASHHS